MKLFAVLKMAGYDVIRTFFSGHHGYICAMAELTANNSYTNLINTVVDPENSEVCVGVGRGRVARNVKHKPRSSCFMTIVYRRGGGAWPPWPPGSVTEMYLIGKVFLHIVSRVGIVFNLCM